MKKLILFLACNITTWIVQAQVTPYTGGNGSGYIGVISAAISCPFYYGGMSDGTALNITTLTVCPPYFGGEGDGYSLQSAQCVIALPVNIITFYGEKKAQQYILHWKLSDDFSVRYIEIEKSSSGNIYATIGTVTGMSAYDHSYSFIDHSSYQDVNFYRLRITERDDKVTYSRVLLMKDFSSASISIYPNPATTTATLYYKAPQSITTRFAIYQNDGRVVFSTYLKLSKGPNSINFDLRHLAGGLYFIRVGESADLIKLMVLKK